MIEKKNWIYKARKGLIGDAMDRMRVCKEWSQLKLRVYYELSRHGKQLNAKKEGLLDEELWAKEENMEQIFELVEAKIQQK